LDLDVDYRTSDPDLDERAGWVDRGVGQRERTIAFAVTGVNGRRSRGKPETGGSLPSRRGGIA
jgi:hypothetical protein